MRGLNIYPRFMGILWKRRFSRRASYLFQLKKVKVQQAIFLEKIFRSHNSKKVQGVVGGGETPFSPHGFFHFLFLFHNIMKHCIDRHAIISMSHNWSLLSFTGNWRRTITNFPPRSYPNIPSLPHDSDHAECRGVTVRSIQLRWYPFLMPSINVIDRKIFNTGSIRVES